MSFTASIDANTIRQWVAAKRKPETLEEELLAGGFDAETILTHLKEYRRLRNAAKQFNGVVCISVGAILGFISCVLSITNPFPDLYNLILFGLTSVAIGLICLGMYFIFE